MVPDVGIIKSKFDMAEDFPGPKVGYEIRELRAIK